MDMGQSNHTIAPVFIKRATLYQRPGLLNLWQYYTFLVNLLYGYICRISKSTLPTVNSHRSPMLSIILLLKRTWSCTQLKFDDI